MSLGCKTDAECAANKDGEDKCDTATGACVCATDKSCQDALNPNLAGTYKCQ